ncbi:MAG: radical SAM protein, partial [Lachnospiraceae bacterium]|nr:radical SAM protein [Lachnospiraceae bacterium]
MHNSKEFSMIYDCLTEEEAKLFAHYKTSHDFCSNSRLGFVFDFYNELLETENILPETPLQVGINLTDICNLKCKHCSRKNLLNLESAGFFVNWKEIIDELAFNGVFQIFLTGGEPLLHPEILEIIEYIKSKNIFIAILTNGLFLTDELIYELDRMLVDEFDYIQISIDGV